MISLLYIHCNKCLPNNTSKTKNDFPLKEKQILKFGILKGTENGGNNQ